VTIYAAFWRKQKILNGIRGKFGDGQCVTFIHNVIVIPAASLWKQGERVRGNVSITPGTVIATFDPDGHYGNHTGEVMRRETRA